MSADPDQIDLIDVKERLRRLSKAERQALVLDPAALARGYHRLRETAPRRQGYLSKNRTGVTASGASSNRIEEHLAVALFNRGALMLPEEPLTLLDYQFPLKAARADRGVGKIDLLGLRRDGTLAIVELKVADNTEDRRIALLEGLIYAAIVEANIDAIVAEFRATAGREIARSRPHIVIAAPPGYWANQKPYPDLGAFHRLVRETAAAVETSILTCRVDDAEDLELGLNGRPPLVRGHAYLSHVANARRIACCRRTTWRLRSCLRSRPRRGIGDLPRCAVAVQVRESRRLQSWWPQYRTNHEHSQMSAGYDPRR